MFAIIIIVIVIVIWGIAGGTFPSTGTNGGMPTGQGCDLCKQLPGYWSGLVPVKKFWMSIWYFWKLMDCYLRGC
jgi:hypothetical protein